MRRGLAAGSAFVLAGLGCVPATAQYAEDFAVSVEGLYTYIAGDYRITATGGRVGVVWGGVAGVEAEYVQGVGQGDTLLSTDGSPLPEGGAYQLDYGYGIYGRVIIPMDDRVRPFLRAGLGGYSFDIVAEDDVIFENVDTNANLVLSLGTGVDLHFNERIGLRFDVTANYVNAAQAATVIALFTAETAASDDGHSSTGVAESVAVQTDAFDGFTTTSFTAFVRF